MGSGRRPYGAWGEQPLCTECHHRRIYHRRMQVHTKSRTEFVVPCSVPRGPGYCGCLAYDETLTIDRQVS